MHAQGPLIADHRPLDARQDQKAHPSGHDEPDESGRDKRRLRRSGVRHEDAHAGDETDDQQSDEGRRVVGAFSAQILAADRATRIDAEIAAEQRASAAIGASPEEAARQREPEVAA